MFISEDKSQYGTIGGGIMELNFIKLSQELLLNKNTSGFTLKIQIHHKYAPEENQSGLICSGEEFVMLGSGLDISLIFYSFNVSLIEHQGSASTIPTTTNTGILAILFIIVVVLVLMTIALLFFKRNYYSTFTNIGAVVLLFIIFLNYYLVDTLNGNILSGVSTSVTDDIGFYVLIFSLLLLFLSSFLKFDVLSEQNS